MQSSEREIEILLRATYPILCVYSHEEGRVESAIQRVLNRKANVLGGKATDLWYWSVTEGAVFHETGVINADGESPYDILEFIDAYESPGVFVLRDYHHFIKEDNPMSVTLWRKLKDMARKLTTVASGKHIIIVGGYYEIPQDLEKLVAVVDFDLPDRSEVVSIINRALEIPELATQRKALEESPRELDKIVDATRGLTLFESESVIARSIASSSSLEIRTILSEKKHIIRKSGVLEFYEVSTTMQSVGGLDNLKAWLSSRGKAFTNEAREYGLPTPKGVLIIGIPGTGKSLISKCVGASWGMPVLRLDVGSLFGSLVGQSEANMRKAIKTSEALAPCILWIDELEKSMGSASGTSDGGTTSRVFGSFLSWMQEKTSPVFVVATANDVSKLPPEMLRKGRFDELFFVDLPSRGDREEILKIHIQRFSRNPDDFNVEEIAEKARDLSGAELEQVVIESLFSAYSLDREPDTSDMLEAIASTVPLVKTMPNKIRSLRTWADTRARSANSTKIETIEEKPDNPVSRWLGPRGRKVDVS